MFAVTESVFANRLPLYPSLVLLRKGGSAPPLPVQPERRVKHYCEQAWLWSRRTASDNALSLVRCHN